MKNRKDELSHRVCSTLRKFIGGKKRSFGRVHLTLRKCKSNPTPPSLFEASAVQEFHNMFLKEHEVSSGSVCFTNHLVPCTSQKGKNKLPTNQVQLVCLCLYLRFQGLGQSTTPVTGRKLLNFVQDKIFLFNK